MTKYYKIGEFAKLIGKTPQTLRDWDKKGIFKPDHVELSGYRYYTQEQANHFLGIKSNSIQEKIVIGYCRVSSYKQKDDLQRQVENVRTYMIANGYKFDIITDIGSGINYNKKGLLLLLDKVINMQVSKIVVLYKDRLVRFGFDLLSYICNKFDTELEIIDNTEKSEEQELVEDLMQIVTVFSCRLQGKRSKNTRRLIEEVTTIASSKESI